MTPTIFAAILLAALLHALWNALAKRQAEGRVSVLLVSLCSGLFAAPLLPLVGWPVAVEYPWLALSILLHCGYCLFSVEPTGWVSSARSIRWPGAVPSGDPAVRGPAAG